MLSDHEREALRELERHLEAEDPKFASSFDTETQGGGRKFRTVLVVIAIVTTAVVGALSILVTGSFGILLGLAIAAGLGWLFYLSIKKIKDTPDPPN